MSRYLSSCISNDKVGLIEEVIRDLLVDRSGSGTCYIPGENKWVFTIDVNENVFFEIRIRESLIKSLTDVYPYETVVDILVRFVYSEIEEDIWFTCHGGEPILQ